MNDKIEKILDLANKAGMSVNYENKAIHHYNNYNYYDMTRHIVKFTELIIQECIEVLRSVPHEEHPQFYEKIKNHFGVKL